MWGVELVLELLYDVKKMYIMCSSGFSLATPKHRSTRPDAASSSSSKHPQSPSRRSQGSPLKAILNNRDNILANVSPARQRVPSAGKKTGGGEGDENAMVIQSPGKTTRSPLKMKGQQKQLDRLVAQTNMAR